MNNNFNQVSKRKILVTGGAGFIGSHLVDRLLANDNQVVVLDNFNDFYNPERKRKNIAGHIKQANYFLHEGDLRNDADLDRLFAEGPFDYVVHLAAMAGVRPSLLNPDIYMDVNVLGTQKLLNRISKNGGNTRFIFGSSSSVYGNRSQECFSETDLIDQPLSPYAASKVAGEVIAYACHKTTGLPIVCLRFFTVFGPRQRPDLAIHKFCRLIDEGKPIDVYGDGTSKRDYTYVADIVSGIVAALTYDLAGFDVINLGRSEPVYLHEMIKCLESALQKKAIINHKPMQVGDMPWTYANIEKAKQLLAYEPKTTFAQGIDNFVAWHLKEKDSVGQNKAKAAI
jgi:UDP-glucuronate 4-epimerase